jgi:hypothetical protein
MKIKGIFNVIYVTLKLCRNSRILWIILKQMAFLLRIWLLQSKKNIFGKYDVQIIPNI